MKKLVAMFVAVAIGLIFVSTVSAQLKVESFEVVKPKAPVALKRDVQTVLDVCFPLANKAVRVLGGSIGEVETEYDPNSGVYFVYLFTERCFYSIIVDSFVESIAIHTLLTVGVKQGYVSSVVLYLAKPIDCNPLPA